MFDYKCGNLEWGLDSKIIRVINTVLIEDETGWIDGSTMPGCKCYGYCWPHLLQLSWLRFVYLGLKISASPEDVQRAYSEKKAKIEGL